MSVIVNNSQQSKTPYVPTHHIKRYAKDINLITDYTTVVFDKRKRPKEYRWDNAHVPLRIQVGLTNRWRNAICESSDLLGYSQNLKSCRVSYSPTYIKRITAETPANSFHINLNEKVKFHPAKPLSSAFHTSKDALAARTSSRRLNASDDASRDLSSKGSSIDSKQNSPANTRTFKRPTNPLSLLKYYKHRAQVTLATDMVITCANMEWEFCSSFASRSLRLKEILSNEYNMSVAFATAKTSERLPNSSKGETQENPSEVTKVPHVYLDDIDASVTPHGVAVALGNLYLNEIYLEKEDYMCAFVAAEALKYPELRNVSLNMMVKSIDNSTVCGYHTLAEKNDLKTLLSACELWLEINFILKLSNSIHLNKMPKKLLEKLLSSPRLFTPNEYSIYMAITTWLFLELNGNSTSVPSKSSLVTYFNSVNATSSYLDTEEGSKYESVFSYVRLHGIIHSEQLNHLFRMNIFNHKRIAEVLTQHYHTLNNGGDMPTYRNFSNSAVRQGFVLDEHTRNHGEVFSMYGFHFLLKATVPSFEKNPNEYHFTIERLKVNDPMLTFQQCERETFSLRPDRPVLYEIHIQYISRMGDNKYFESKTANQRFGLHEKSNKSKGLILNGIVPPVYVTFMLLFPAT